MKLPAQRYVSSELAHFVGKRLEVEEQYRLLVKILGEGWLSHPPHTPNISGNLIVNASAGFSSNHEYNPQMVCFCDIPIADLGIHVSKYSPFGLSFSKDFIVQKGGCPVFYIPLQSRVRAFTPIDQRDSDWWVRVQQSGKIDDLEVSGPKSEYFDRMMQGYLSLMQSLVKSHDPFAGLPGNTPGSLSLYELQRFLDFHVFSFIKFYDHEAADDNDDNHYLEREWRVLGNIEFSLGDVQTVFMPRAFAVRFRADCPLYTSQLWLFS